MALDLQQMFDKLKQARDASSDGSSLKDILGKAVSSFDAVSKSMKDMSVSIRDIRSANMVSRRVGQADDVKAQIKALMTTKIEEDKIERERHKRMMDIAEELIPQVTAEQLEAVKAQREAWREHQKNLQAELAMEKDIATIRKTAATEVAEKEIAVAKENLKVAQFAQKDKYGTIKGAIGGLAGKAQDPLSKFLVEGLGRFVSEKKEAPLAESTQAEFDKFKKEREAKLSKDIADIEALSVEHQEDIKEAYAVEAAKNKISDQGSAAKLYQQRDAEIAKYAGIGAGAEKGIATGTYGKTPADVAKEAKLLEGASPAALRAIGGTYTPVAPPNGATFAKAGGQEPPSPAGARGTAPTAPITPANGGAVKAATGILGGKGGFLNIGGIVGSLGSLAGNFTKFLGPWGLVANMAMSVDRTMPIISDGASALMDMTKLIMPMTLTALIEGFGGVMDGLTSIVNALPGMDNYDKDKEIQASINTKFGQYSEEAFKQWDARNAAQRAATAKALSKGVYSKNVTSASKYGTIIKPKAFSRDISPVTNPIESNRILSQATTQNNATATAIDTAWIRQQQQQNEAMRESVIAASKNPGTTPIFESSPYLSPIPA